MRTHASIVAHVRKHALWELRSPNKEELTGARQKTWLFLQSLFRTGQRGQDPLFCYSRPSGPSAVLRPDHTGVSVLGFEVYDDETLEDLQLNNLRLIQKRDAFRFGMDAVLLADFAKAGPGDSVVDLGTGSGIVAILMSARTQAEKIIGLEIQPEIADMARRSVEGNGLSHRISIQQMDIREAASRLPVGKYDVVVTNPPYTRCGGGLINPNESRAIARHEILCTLEDVVKAAAHLLRVRGEFYMVHRPDRLCDIMVEMRKNQLEPKVLRMVCPRPGDPPSLLLVMGIRNGNPGMKLLAPLYIYDTDGNYTGELRSIYGLLMR